MGMLCEWLNHPHMRRYYQKNAISLAEVRKKYLPRLASEHPIYCHIAVVDSCPVGKFQCYLSCDYKDFLSELGEKEGVSVDFFIGEEAYLGRGFGKVFLHRYVLDTVTELFPEEKVCYICYAENNHIAIKCSVGVGFKAVKNIIEDGKRSVLLEYKF